MTTRSELTEQLKSDSNPPTRKVGYQYEYEQQSTGAAASYSPSNNAISVTVVKGQDNKYNLSKSVLAHEQKHKDNHKLYDSDNVPMSLEQHYKINCYDEISANITQLLQVREEYLAAKTPAEKEKIAKENSKYDYYFKAIKEGKFKPEANSEQEMRFIAVETQNMWINGYSLLYDENHTDSTLSKLEHKNYKDLAPNNANYNKVRKAYMTIGGIDFSKYVKDIPCLNEDVKKADKEIANKSTRNIVKRTLAKKKEVIELPKKAVDTKGMSIKQAYEAARNQMFIENFMEYTEDAILDIPKKDLDKYKKNITKAMKDFSNELKNNPTMKKSWEKAEKELAEKLLLNKLGYPTTDLLSYTYEQKIRKTATVENGVNIQDYCDVKIQSLLPKTPTPENIKNPYKDHTDITNTLAEYQYTSYQGKPIYTNKEEHKEIYDFTKPFLKDRMSEADKQRAARQQTKQTLKDQNKAANSKTKATKESEKTKKDVKSKNQPSKTNKKQNQSKQTTLTPAQIAAKKKQNQK